MPWMREDLAPTYAEKLGISKQELEQLKQNASQTDILFVDNMIHQYSRYFLNIPSEDKILTALYLVKHYDSATARKKLKEAGYTESYFLWADYGEIGHIQAAYDLAQQGISTAQQDEAYDQRLNAERTAFLSIMGGQLVNRLMTGPAFDAATGYSDKSMLDQLEKNGYLTAEQRKTIDSRFNQGMETSSKSNQTFEINIKFGSNVKSADKLERQLSVRGWTYDDVSNTVNNAFTTRKSINRATGNPATVYYNKDGSHVIIDDNTNEVVQVSNKFDPNWIPDPNIINPYIPQEKGK